MWTRLSYLMWVPCWKRSLFPGIWLAGLSVSFCPAHRMTGKKTSASGENGEQMNRQIIDSCTVFMGPCLLSFQRKHGHLSQGALRKSAYLARQNDACSSLVLRILLLPVENLLSFHSNIFCAKFKYIYFKFWIGTFQAETNEEIAYGLVHPLASWDPVWTQVRINSFPACHDLIFSLKK